MSKADRLVTAPVRERLLQLRRDLHRHPELAFQEEQTAVRLLDELATLHPVSLERVAGTGVVARIRGEDPGAPVVAVRGDIDALPIQEDTGLDFSSERPGVMHACGHDVHASWAVGAGYLLSERPARGDVLVVLQPAEETGQGAEAVLKSGALDPAVAIFGAHVDRRFDIGQVVVQSGALAAAADSFSIEVIGRGAHGARPHEGRDPIVGAAALVGALQTIVSRRLSPGTPAVVSVGVLRAGTAPNIIPETAHLEGTVRALDPATRELLHREIERIVQAVADAHGLEARLEIDLGPPAIINRDEPVSWARDAVAATLGAGAVVPLGSHNMAAEDFAFYLERMTGCFLRVGAREPGGEFIPAHTPRFYAADESVLVGAAVLAETARIASSRLAAAG